MSDSGSNSNPLMIAVLVIVVAGIIGFFIFKTNQPVPKPAESQIIHGPGTPGGAPAGKAPAPGGRP